MLARCSMKEHLLILVCMLVIATLPVKAAWTLEARLVYYTNPGNIDFQGQCCDPHTLCISPCDVYFTFCLRSINLSPASPGDCQQLVTTTRWHTATTGAIHPPTEGPLYDGSPVNNPIRFVGNYWGGRFQVLVSTEDADSDADDLIDRNAFNQVLPPTGEWTSVIRVHGFYKAAHVAMQFKASCDQYYYSQTCTVYCKAQDDNVEGHYNCNSEGGKVCLTGWSDPNNNCLTPICADGCRNGVCSEPGECSCLSGWFGELCDECHPGPSCSAEHGRCVNSPGECVCDTGYDGENCDQDLDVCGHQQPCLYGATCSNEGPDQHSCSCAAGYTGNNCQIEINECSPLPCLNGATCIDRIGEFNCQCAPGWTGHTCDTNIDECDPNPCDNGGTCTDLVDDYICECSNGYLQPDCEGHQCDLNPCENSGTCMNATDGYDCVCSPGYSGFNCSEEADECESSPCENGGTCTDLFADFNCTCQVGFTGETCQFDIDYCVGAKCSPHSICIDGNDSYTCLCNQGYTGEYCDVMIDYCASPNPCQNGATCTSFVSGPSCHCAPGYTGKECDQEIDHCANSSCLNNGTCVNMPLTYTCSCHNGWTGSNCKERVSACESNPCLEGQICLDTDDFSYECQICTIDGCEIIIKPIVGSVTPSPSNLPNNMWIIYGSVIGGIFLLIFVCFFLILFCMLACILRKKSRKSFYQSLSAQEIRQVHNNPTYVDPRELVTSKSYAVENQNTPEGIPLVNPMAATYGAQTNPSNFNQLTAPPAAKSNTLIGRSGRYDRLQPQDEEEEAFDNPTQNED